MLQWRAFAMALTLVTEASLMFLWRCSYIWIERSDTPDSYAVLLGFLEPLSC